MKFFDSHAHYNDALFGERFPGGADGAIALSREAGCAGILNAGTSPETSRECIALAGRYDFFYAAAGIHPYDCAFLEGNLNDSLDEIRALCAHPKVRAIGEIGLDYHYEGIDRELQKRYFTAQLELARELDMPVIIHDTDPRGYVHAIRRPLPAVKAVLHSFSGSAEDARQLCRGGRYISFSGTVTYKNARNVHEAAAAVCDELLLVETDAPYLPPVPHRGKINLSAYIPFTVSALASVRSRSEEDIAELTLKNAEAFFGI